MPVTNVDPFGFVFYFSFLYETNLVSNTDPTQSIILSVCINIFTS